MTISAESCNFCLRYASDVHEKFMRVCVETNPNSNSNPSNEIFLMLGTKIMNHYSLLECRQSITRLHRHKHKHASLHTSRSAYLSPHYALLSDGSCSSIRSGSHSVGVPCTLWRSPQSTNFIPSQSFRPFIYIKERHPCSFTLICLSACYFHSARHSFAGVRFRASSHYSSYDFLLW